MRDLVEFLNQLPATRVISNSDEMADEAAELARLIAQERGDDASESSAHGLWWIKLNIDITKHLAWHVVQELGYVLNYISLDERLPTVFKPVSTPPALNGGPDVYLGWVIESTLPNVDPLDILYALEDRLPKPPTKLKQWTPCENEPCPLRSLKKRS